jgi:hypothetical protein
MACWIFHAWAYTPIQEEVIGPSHNLKLKRYHFARCKKCGLAKEILLSLNEVHFGYKPKFQPDLEELLSKSGDIVSKALRKAKDDLD